MSAAVEDARRPGGKLPAAAQGRAPRRVQLSREPGWKTSPSTIRVDGCGRWRNPFEGEPFSVNKFIAFLLTSPDRVYVHDGKTTVYPSNEAIRRDLGGFDLACFCDWRERCHGDVLIKIANGRRWPRRRPNRTPRRQRAAQALAEPQSTVEPTTGSASADHN